MPSSSSSNNDHPTLKLLSSIKWQDSGPRVGTVLENLHAAAAATSDEGVTTVVCTVHSYAPSQPSPRLPELWRVEYKSESSSFYKIWLEQDFVEYENNQKRDSDNLSLSLSFPPNVHYERLTQRLQHDVECLILPKLLLLAICEESMSDKLESLYSSNEGTTNNTANTTAAASSTAAALYYEQPKYYKQSPSSYMVAPVLRTTTTAASGSESQHQDSSSFNKGYTPAVLASRLKQCCKLLADYHEQQQYVVQYYSSEQQYVRRSSRLPPPPPPTLPQPYVMRGARMAMYLVVNEDNNESGGENEEKEQDDMIDDDSSDHDSDKKPAAAKKKKKKRRSLPSSVLSPPPANLPDKRERKQVHSDGAAAASLEEVLGGSSSDEGDSENDESEEEFSHDDNDSEESEDEELEVDTRRVEKVAQDDNDEQDDEDSSLSLADTVDDESELINDNPYLKPSNSDILEYLARRGKALSAADVQQAMICCLQHKLTLTPSIPLDRMALGLGESNVRITLECTSGEKLSELKKMDPTEFARRKFIWKIARNDEDAKLANMKKEDKKALKKRLELEYQEAELTYREEKAWASWRHKGIYNGYAVWPHWEESWRAQQEPRESTTQVAAAASVARPTDQQVTTAAASAVPQEESDQALAEALAESSAGLRRTRRSGAAEGGGGVFYGMQSQMTSKQLMDAILRLTTPGSFQTLMSLRTLVQEESSNPIHRIRVAVGRLIWRRNQLVRCTVNAFWGDAPLWRNLRAGPLLKPVVDEPETSHDETADDTIVADNTDENGSGAAPAVESSSAVDNTKHVEILAAYVRGLHQTELQLRSMILEHLTYVPIAAVATAADERIGSLEASDAAEFEEGAAPLPWSTGGHRLLGKVLFRPPPGHEQEAAECQWYKVYDFVPAVESQIEGEEMNGEATGRTSSVPEPRNVERRARFRAYPFPVDGESQIVSGAPIVLTEAQVHAGMVAASRQQKEAAPVESNAHPFQGATHHNVTLRGLGAGSGVVMFCKIVGHDTVTVAASSGSGAPSALGHRILVLPDAPDNAESTRAFWATVHSHPDGSLTCQSLVDGKMFSISQSDFHSASPAFQSCKKIVEFLKHQPQAQIFMEPVDPVALNIPTYFSVIKHPMDISTLTSNLESGLYSQVPPNQNPGLHPVARMLNGPFKEDVFRIFDNAMLFNPPDDWIHLTAAATKKNVAKKIEQISKDANQGLIGSHYLRPVKKSIYVDEDSDADMYDYESDRDDEEYDGRRRNLKKKRKRPGGKRDDESLKAMEAPIRLQNVLSETQGLRGPFADLNIRSNASEFSMSNDWNCRHKAPVAAEIVEENPVEKKERAELAELYALQREAEEMERAGLRRSTRAHASEQAGVFDQVLESSNVAPSDVEYFLSADTCPPLDDYSTPENNAERTASNRTEVEAHREALHEEYYSVLYQRLFKRLQSTDGYGTFANNLFPPFLGRVIPCVEPTDSTEVAWEIRSAYVIPAIRWVLRGLVQSGHFSEIEPGVILANNVYSLKEGEHPFDVLDLKEVQRRKRATIEEQETSEEEIEMSEYEKLRAERVARNAERLKALGLA